MLRTIIIKILKEGIYGTPGDRFGLGNDPFREIENRPIREKLEKELLSMALKDNK